MSHKESTPIWSAEPTENPWRNLKMFTDARIALGRTGVSLPTQELLAFQLAHSKAKDAVHLPLDTQHLVSELQALTPTQPVLTLQSQANDRTTYLQRPDLGRTLSHVSQHTLQTVNTKHSEGYDIAFAVVDGLSSTATQNNSVPFLKQLLEDIHNSNALKGISLAPICVVEQGRVAIGDHIGECLHAKMVIVLIGERPGLSSPDSLGLYLSWNPRSGLTDAQRNCISNIRPAGLRYAEASRRALYLIEESHRLKLSGVHLKDRSHEKNLQPPQESRHFLTK